MCFLCRRHASLPGEVMDNPGNMVSASSRRGFPCRKWKSASFGYGTTLLLSHLLCVCVCVRVCVCVCVRARFSQCNISGAVAQNKSCFTTCSGVVVVRSLMHAIAPRHKGSLVRLESKKTCPTLCNSLCLLIFIS